MKPRQGWRSSAAEFLVPKRRSWSIPAIARESWLNPAEPEPVLWYEKVSRPAGEGTGFANSRSPVGHSRSIAVTWSRLRIRAYIFIALSRL
jgi:hypothetical protein